ncbi:hypothetical protein [Sphingomonas panaciterrae]|uniref:hypothetical protein n=1 Tax=Sphingomonas panaciterrae TaxID=1462999 RepID=UPI002FF02C27
MAGDGLTDEEAEEFWRRARIFVGDQLPSTIIQLCEVVLLGGALNVAHRFTGSTLLLALYYALLLAFALRIVGRFLPKKYDSPLMPLLGGLAIAGVITVAEDKAIRAAADAALIQMQSDKAIAIIRAQALRDRDQERVLRQVMEACGSRPKSTQCDTLLNAMDELDSRIENMMRP